MAQATQQKTLEREYIIPLRREWMKVPQYKRTAKSVRAIKEFIAKHMRVPDRDTNKVKLDVYLNNELWFKGCKKPFTKIKVRAVKEGDIIRVALVEMPESIKFLKAKQEKRHEKVEKKKAEARPEEEKKEGLKEKVGEKAEGEKTEEEKKEELEKARSVEVAQEKMLERAAKVEKHLTKGKGPQVHRKALKK